MTRRSRRGLPRAQGEGFPPRWRDAYEKVSDLRYGENPHQQAAFYARVGSPTHLLAGVEQLHGKELSFNNLLDLSSARELVEEFDEPACAIVKHNNPCGCAIGASGREAYERAFACDPQSAYGGVIAVNRPIDLAFAEELGKQFIEVLLAPGYDAPALRGAAGQEKRAPAGARRLAGATAGGRIQARDRRPASADPRRRLGDARADERGQRAAAKRAASGRTCCSRGRSAGTCAPTRS